MNERIKELLPNPFAVDYQARETPLDLYTEVEMQKFASRIIEECAAIMRARLFPDYEGNSHKVAHNNALLCAISDLNELMENEE
jgi:hypothetical protein